jgi:hypothetical protein
MRHNTLQIRPQEKLETHEWLEIDSFCSSTLEIDLKEMWRV